MFSSTEATLKSDLSLPYAGITRIRFRGFDLSPCFKAPLLNFHYKGNTLYEDLNKFVQNFYENHYHQRPQSEPHRETGTTYIRP